MATSERPQLFQKLKLDTYSTPKPASSPFASISRLHDGDHGEDGAAQEGSRDSPENLSSSITSLDLSESLSQSGDIGHPRLCSSPQQSLDAADSAIAVLSPDSDTATLGKAMRKRRTSISFDPQVTSDDGNRFSIDTPLPKSDLLKARGRSMIQEFAKSQAHVSPHDRVNGESAMSEYDPHTGQPLDRRKDRPRPLYYRVGESRHPLLQSTVDGLAQHTELGEFEKVASLTSGTTASPAVEEVHTPPEPSVNYLLSPVSAASPIDFPSRRTRSSSQLSRSRRPDTSSTIRLRRLNRRSSTRTSAASSMSPASAFLSQWGREEASSIVEPDDEGQEIGDHSGYIIGRQIGFGGFSVVKEVFTIEHGEKVRRAVKIVRKQVPGKSEHENERLQTDFEHEVGIWRFLRHRYILPLLAVYDTPFATYCITRLNTGGTLFDLVRSNRRAAASSKTSAGLPTKLARRYVYQLASALRYLHEDVHIVHRDIKLENCLLDMSGPDAAAEGGKILLCDFGMADFITNEHRNSSSPEPQGEEDGDFLDHRHRNIGPSATSTSVVGSLQYAAPELINAPCTLYSTAVDIWALGVVIYALLTGELPFQHGFEPRLVAMILKGEWDFKALQQCPAVENGQGGEDAIQLVWGCLEMTPEGRWSVGEVLRCKWLEGCEELYGEGSDDGEMR